jgi:hypothetical protein
VNAQNYRILYFTPPGFDQTGRRFPGPQAVQQEPSILETFVKVAGTALVVGGVSVALFATLRCSLWLRRARSPLFGVRQHTARRPELPADWTTDPAQNRKDRLLCLLQRTLPVHGATSLRWPWHRARQGNVWTVPFLVWSRWRLASLSHQSEVLPLSGLTNLSRGGRMSGGGGGGGDTWRPEPSTVVRKSEVGSQAGSGGESPPRPCDIVETTTLNSPVRSVVATLRAGDVLEVVLDPGPPRRLLAQRANGDVAGAITSPSMLQLIRCITDGQYQYVAEVLSMRGAICQVRIRPR